MKRAYLKIVPLFLIVALLGGCATMATPQTPKQVLVVSYETIAALADAAGSLYEAKVITYEQKNQIADKLDGAHDALQVADGLRIAGLDPERKIKTARTLIQEVRKIIHESTGEQK